MSFGKKSIGISTLMIVLIAFIATAAVATTAVFVFLRSGWFPSAWVRVVGSGNVSTEEQGFSDFTIVDVGNSFDVEITQSSSYGVDITADDNLFEYIQVSKTGNTLKIRLKWGYIYESVAFRAKITMPDLHELEFSGATHGTAVGFSSSHELALGLSGASSLHVVNMSAAGIKIDLSGASNLSGDLTASGDAQLIVSGASSIELDGAAKDLVISASGASHLELFDFPVQDANVVLSGASHATVNLDGILDANLSGASHLLYIGNPTLGDIRKSGSSTVKEK